MSLLDTASLIVTPNGYKEGKLYSVIPSDGSGDLSVTRATTATRVNSQGLVELVPYNLVQYSEDFTNADWQKYQLNVSANQTTAPDGTSTADLITQTGPFAGTFYKFPWDYYTGAITASCYFKKGTGNVAIIEGNPPSSDFSVLYNLDTEVITPSGPGYISSNIENLNNGWYRCSVVANGNGTGYIAFGSYNSNGSTMYAWGAQLNEGTLKDYQKTETRLNIPRLDYSNGTCPSILVEPQRTNRALYSSSFDNGSWDKAFVSVTANQIASPSGVQDADKLVENSANEIHALYNLQPYTSTTTATASVFFKKGTRKFFSIKLQIGGNSYTQVYDSENVTTTSNSSNGLTNVSSSIVDFGNGWVRAILTGTNPSGAADAYTIYGLSNSGTPTFNPSNFNPTYQGTGTDFGYIWGAQLEAGSYATSYIPTTSASVTRNADVISKTGISSLIGQTEGTLFFDFNKTHTYSNDGELLIMNYANANPLTNRVQIVFIGNNLELYATDGTNAVYSGTITSVANGKHKIAVTYGSGGYVVYLDGVSVFSNSATWSPTMDSFRIGSYATSVSFFSDTINATSLWKTRLTNAQLATLTTI